MGDFLTNKLALEDVIGSIYPQHKGVHHPSVSADRCPGAFFVTNVMLASIVNPTKMDWEGYALHVLPDTPTNIDISVSFSNHFEDSVTLRCGDHIDVPRGFRQCWVRGKASPGQTITGNEHFKILIERVPLIRPKIQSPVSVHADKPLPVSIQGGVGPVSVYADNPLPVSIQGGGPGGASSPVIRSAIYLFSGPYNISSFTSSLPVPPGDYVVKVSTLARETNGGDILIIDLSPAPYWSFYFGMNKQAETGPFSKQEGQSLVFKFSRTLPVTDPMLYISISVHPYN